MTWTSLPPEQNKVKIQDYQRKWRSDRRQHYMDKLGPCYFCGTMGNREIHHVDPSEKDSHKIWSWKPERIEKELLKCIVLCRDCHIKLHKLMRRNPLVHGTLYGYQVYKCRCPLCTEANRIKGNYWNDGFNPELLKEVAN